MLKASFVAEIASLGKRIGTPYDQLDCQALMERLLSDAGVDHPNWRGSNNMWREALSEKHKLNDNDPATLPAGAWLFTVKNDGGEVKRGYHDNEGNAVHVGMYLGGGRVIHSTRGGVQWDTLSNKRWTHAGLCKLLDYTPTDPVDAKIVADAYYKKLVATFDNMKEVINKWPF